MKRKFLQRLGALLMALCMLLTMPGGALARTLGEVEAEQKELEQKEAELEDTLSQLRDNEAQKREYLNALQEKIDNLQVQVDTARRNINDLNDKITELTLKLEESQKAIQGTIDQFKERLVALYKAGNVSTLEILLNSSSFSDFTMRSELIKTMTARDQKMVGIIEEYMDNTQDEREEQQASKQKVAELKKGLEEDQKKLNDLYDENAQALSELEAAESATQDQLQKVQEDREKNDQEMKDIIEEQRRLEEERRQQQNSNHWDISYPGGSGGIEGFHPIWPLPGVSYVSCYYGGYAGHRGMDIAGPWGTAVVAAESGTVIKANDYDSWGDSWGYYVLIYHNGTFTTRYAHLSSLAVVQGQYVEQGTIVGYEGATGNVTGPHLHFEVYENGNRVDPMRYL